MAEGGKEGWVPRCKYCGAKWPMLKLVGLSICYSCAYEIMFTIVIGSTARAMQGKKKKGRKKSK
jgi:hypothetical protein